MHIKAIRTVLREKHPLKELLELLFRNLSEQGNLEVLSIELVLVASYL